MFKNDLSMLIHQSRRNSHDETTKAEIIRALRDKASELEREKSAPSVVIPGA